MVLGEKIAAELYGAFFVQRPLTFPRELLS